MTYASDKFAMKLKFSSRPRTVGEATVAAPASGIRSSKWCRAALCVLFTVSVLKDANAQTLDISAADREELSSYRLTMDVAKKAHAAMLSLIKELANDPIYLAFQKTNAEIEVLSNKQGLTPAENEQLERLEILVDGQGDALYQVVGDLGQNSGGNLDQREASVMKNPRLTAALRRAGLTPRDYCKYHFALLIAAMVAHYGESRQEPPEDLVMAAHPDNAKFIKENAAELMVMRQELAERSNVLVGP